MAIQEGRVGCAKRVRYMVGGILFGPLLTIALVGMIVSGEHIIDKWWEVPVGLIVLALGWWTFYSAVTGRE